MRFLTRLPLVLAMGLAACSSSSEDGEINRKDDSFGSPTEHGELSFESANRADFDDVFQFHSWTFTLDDEADINLVTEVSKNLDTVMYLYRRDPGTSAWGSNIAKNDDHASSLGSRITLADAEPGEYRVKVKAAKILLRGDFELMAQCDGAGCPQAPTLPTGFEPLPTQGMTEDCAIDFMNATASRTKLVGSPEFIEFPNPVLVGLSPIEHKALGHYIDYWDNVFSFEDLLGGDGSVVVEGRETIAGFVMEVDAEGHDESAMTLVYNDAMELVMLYQHNQSPDSQWFCDESAGDVADEPDMECAMNMIESFAHLSEDNSEEVTTMAELNNASFDHMVTRGIEAIEADHSPDPDEELTLFIDTWNDDGTGAVISFDSGFAIGSYYVDSEGRLMAHFTEEGDLHLVCEGF